MEIPEVSWSPSLAPGDTLLGLCSGTAWPQHFLPPFSPPRGLKGRRAGVGAGVLKVGPAGGVGRVRFAVSHHLLWTPALPRERLENCHLRRIFPNKAGSEHTGNEPVWGQIAVTAGLDWGSQPRRKTWGLGIHTGHHLWHPSLLPWSRPLQLLSPLPTSSSQIPTPATTPPHPGIPTPGHLPIMPNLSQLLPKMIS